MDAAAEIKQLRERWESLSKLHGYSLPDLIAVSEVPKSTIYRFFGKEPKPTISLESFMAIKHGIGVLEEAVLFKAGSR